jgi:hypothetical protein
LESDNTRNRRKLRGDGKLRKGKGLRVGEEIYKLPSSVCMGDGLLSDSASYVTALSSWWVNIASFSVHNQTSCCKFYHLLYRTRTFHDASVKRKNC